MQEDDHPAFSRLGPAEPHSPVIVSVPHAGRDYPPDLLGWTPFGPERLLALEDRHADHLAAPLADRGHMVLVARTPRAWIDLNRDEQDVDPAMLYPPQRPVRPLSSKARGGLGLIPRRTAGLGELWRKPISTAELAHRIETIHRPWHAQIEQAMAAAVAKFGAALLLDIHSMPSLPQIMGQKSPQIVIGDRFGRSCSGRYAARAAGTTELAGLSYGFNAPYAGGYSLDRHGNPAQNCQALQIEIDRALYLAPNMRDIGNGLACMQRYVVDLADALADEMLASPIPLAAE